MVEWIKAICATSESTLVDIAVILFPISTLASSFVVREEVRFASCVSRLNKDDSRTASCVSI